MFSFLKSVSVICAVVDNVLSVTGIDMGSAIYPLQERCCVYGAVRMDGEIIFLLSMEDLIMRGNENLGKAGIICKT